MDKFQHGTVVLLEDDDNAVTLGKKCAAIRSLGMNTVVAWPPVFYKNGKRDFTIQHTLLDCAKAESLKVVIELTGQVYNLEYLPDSKWVADYSVLNFDGTPELMQNGLGELNYNHPEVKRHLKEFFEETVAEFRDHPALIAWDIWNETHFKSYDKYTIAEFQKWLKAKYGDIEKLNALWKKSYTAFEQIHLDPVTWAAFSPDCDWEEFRTDNLTAIAAEWAAIVRNADPEHPIIADNVMSNAVWSEFDRGTDDWKLAKTVNHFGISFYPKTGGRLLKYNEAWLRQLAFAGAASAGNGSFMVSEMQSHCYSEIFTRERVSSDELLDWDLEALFQGAKSVIYWKWEPFRSGFQTGGRGLVLADGTLSKRTEAVSAFSRLLDTHPDIEILRPFRYAAVLYDRASNFTVKGINNRVQKIIGDAQCAEARFGVAKTAYERNVPLAVVTTEQFLNDEIDSIKLLFLPYQTVMSDNLAESLRNFMENGGTVAANYPFGDISPLCRLYLDVPGGPLNGILKVRQTDNVIDSFKGEEIEIQELELLDPNVKVLLYSDAGRPLLLHIPYGKGGMFYFASALWNDVFCSNRTTCANTLWNILLENRALPFTASLPVTASHGNVYDYLLISNEENQSECTVDINGKAELIFGSGTLESIDNKYVIKNPRHAVLRISKEK